LATSAGLSVQTISGALYISAYMKELFEDCHVAVFNGMCKPLLLLLEFAPEPDKVVEVI